MDSELPEDKQDRAIELRKHLSSQPDWPNLLKQWNLASRMRLWIQEKKKNLIERIEREAADEMIKEKKEAAEKKKKEEEKKKEDEEKKKEEDEKKEESKDEEKKEESE